jgi:hypothetical protein
VVPATCVGDCTAHMCVWHYTPVQACWKQARVVMHAQLNTRLAACLHSTTYTTSQPLNQQPGCFHCHACVT